MCLAVPAEIVIVNGTTAVVETMGIRKNINVQLIENPTVGDFVLLHAGFAIEKIDAEYHRFLKETYEEFSR